MMRPHIVLEDVSVRETSPTSLDESSQLTTAQDPELYKLSQIESNLASFESNGFYISLDDAELPIHKLVAFMKGTK